MARVLVVSRNAAMAMGLSATEHDVVDLRPPAFQHWMDTGDRDFDALVLDLDEPTVALDAVTELRARALLAPALLVSSDRPGWTSPDLRHLPAAQVLPLPISRPALLSALEDLLEGADFDLEDEAPGSPDPGPPADTYGSPEDAEEFVADEEPEHPGPGTYGDVGDEYGDVGDEDDESAEATGYQDEEPSAVPTVFATDPDARPATAPVAATAVAQVPAAPHLQSQPFTDEDVDSFLGAELEPEPPRGEPATAAALHELHEDDEDESDEFDVDPVPVVAPHDYQRELGLSARPELPVALAPAAATTARAGGSDRASGPAAKAARRGSPTPVPPAPSGPAPARAKATTPPVPTSRRTPSPEPGAARPRPLQRRDRAAEKAAAAKAGAPGRLGTEAARGATASPAVQPEATRAGRLHWADPVALVRRLLEADGELYGVPETADVVVADAVERTRAEAGALMIPDAGAWRVAGGVNLRALEQRYELRSDSWLVLEIARGHKGAIIEDSDIARQPLQGAPLASWKHLLAMPIPHVEGLLLLARSDETFTERDLAELAGLVDEAGPLLSSAVDVRRLARLLDGFRDEG